MATRRPTDAPSIAPSLADLTQDIAGPLPVELLRAWASGARTKERANELLAPFRREGTVGTSDASGLSRLSQERPLLEVVWLIAQPKQLVYAVGTAIGGDAIGTWVADNTEMFYPASIPVDDVVDAMIETQARIAERASVMIGICLHTGVFYEIGGGLYGADARAAEVLAEDHARASELLVTNALHERLREPSRATFERRGELDAVHPPGVYRVRSSRRFPSLREGPGRFPHGFPTEFFDALGPSPPAAKPLPDDDAKMVERFVVFLVRERALHADDDLPAILDDFVADARVATVVAEHLREGAHLAESSGGLAVVVFERGQDALDFARLVRERLHGSGLELKLGIDYGAVLIFAGKGIFGDPVNLASKISEDLGQTGRINITDRAAAGMSGLASGERFAAEISGIRVSGVVV